MKIDGISQSTGAERVVAVEAERGRLSVAVTDRSGAIVMGRAVLPPEGLMTILVEKPLGSQTVAEGVTVEVRRNEVWLVVGQADAAVGLDDLMDAVGSTA
ncbi:MAG TPA: hypothetical protein VM597_08965 [Gemmataceae bacterium]|jgi:hypothetical protein|nr:hypothetical protein [Gemmataceae bacterium]